MRNGRRSPLPLRQTAQLARPVTGQLRLLFLHLLVLLAQLLAQFDRLLARDDRAEHEVGAEEAIGLILGELAAAVRPQHLLAVLGKGVLDPLDDVWDEVVGDLVARDAVQMTGEAGTAVTMSHDRLRAQLQGLEGQQRLCGHFRDDLLTDLLVVDGVLQDRRPRSGIRHGGVTMEPLLFAVADAVLLSALPKVRRDAG